MLSLFLSLTSVSAEDLDIYTEQLRNGFEDWGWASHSLSNTSPVHARGYSIAVTAGPWAGLYLHHKEMDTHGYTNLSLWAHGGENGGQILRIGSKIGTNDQANFSFPPLPAGRWTLLQVPLRVLEADDRTNFCGFLIQLRDNCPTGTFYLDDIKLEAVRAASSAGATGEGAHLEQHPSAAPSSPQPESAANLNLWIAVGVGTSIVLLIWLVAAVRRGARSDSHNLVPARTSIRPPPTSPEGTFEFVSAEDWRQRAITAEEVASKQARILRENLMPELAEFAKERVVQGLSAQRGALMETQRRAQQELADLESRLAALHLPLRERILVYESRISELEKELATRGEEMRELIRATLSLVRARLEEEKKKEVQGNGSRHE